MSKYINTNVTAEIRLFFIHVFIILMLLPSIHIHSQAYNLEDQLILWLPVDGNAIDQSGNNIRTEVNGPTLTADRFGNPNSAYAFDGNGDHIKLNNDQPLITSTSFTILLWAKVNGPSNTISGDQSFFQQRDDDANQASAKSTIYFNISKENRVSAKIRTFPSPDGSADIFEEAVYDISNWHHYVLRLNKERKVELFVDAVKVYSGTLTEPGNFTTSIDHVDLGVHTYSNTLKAALNGILDDIYVYNRALSDCEIKIIYSGEYEEER